MMFKKICLSILLAVLSISYLSLSTSVNVEAATGYQAYAIYREGNGANLFWHAGILNDPYSTTTSKPVIHIAKQTGNKVAYDSWGNFRDSKAFKGVYRPKSGITSAGRDNVRSMANKLRGRAIPYTVLAQIDYPAKLISGSATWVKYTDLLYIRCDGVVEYSYEWYGYKIAGGNTYWDITRATQNHLNQHSGFKVTPRSQAQTHMTLVKSSTP